jgi:hypothetical protein
MPIPGPLGPAGPAGPPSTLLDRICSWFYVTWSDIYWDWIPGTVIDTPIDQLACLSADPNLRPDVLFDNALIWLKTNVGTRNISYSFDLIISPRSNALELRIKFLRRSDAMLWVLLTG